MKLTYLCWHIHDCLEARKSFLDTLFYRQVISILFQDFAFHDQRSHLQKKFVISLLTVPSFRAYNISGIAGKVWLMII